MASTIEVDTASQNFLTDLVLLTHLTAVLTFCFKGLVGIGLQ
jgi:hypothetical protein